MMVYIESFSVFLINFSLLGLLLLGLCRLALVWVQQPAERVRLIQVTMVLVVAAGLFSATQFGPAIQLGWLPQSEAREQHDAANPAADAAPVSLEKAAGAIPDETEFAGNRMSHHAGNGLPAGAVQSDMPGGVVPAELHPESRPAIRAGGPVAAPNTITQPPDVGWWSLVSAVLVIGFGLGTLVQAGRFLLGIASVHRLFANSICAAELKESPARQRILDFATARRVRIFCSSALTVPIAAGWLRPAIVLPQKLVYSNQLRDELLQALEHEWKHIDRRDLAFWQLLNLFEIVLWYQPLFWLLRKELRINQDLIADAHAANSLDDCARYAATLVQFAQQRQCQMEGTLAMTHHRSSLFRRVEMLLNDQFVLRKSRTAVIAGFLCCMLTAAFGLTSLRLTHASAATQLQANEPESADLAQQESADSERAGRESHSHSGRVTDNNTGEAVANATVIVTRMNSRTWEMIDRTESVTDEKGEYTFEIPPAQVEEPYLYLMFDLRHATYAPRHCGSYSYSMIQKNLEVGDKPWFSNLKFTKGAEVSGRVVDKQGRPVADAEIRLSSEAPGEAEGFANHSRSKLRTDQDGRFVAVVTAEGNASISIIPHDYCMLSKDIGTRRGELGDFELAGWNLDQWESR